jgi:hypothetical protein
LAQDLLFCPAQDTFSAWIPGHDAAPRVHIENREIAGALDQQAEAFFDLRQFPFAQLAYGDVLKRTHHSHRDTVRVGYGS